MKIVKNCRAQHHISRTRTIQIGTLNYYRMSDNKFIVDPHEGFGVHCFQSERSKIIFPEKDATTLAEERLVGARLVINPGGKLTADMWAPNVYIFCCSLVERATKAFASQFGYDSFYEISDPDLFMAKVQEGFPGVARLRDKSQQTVEIVRVHGPVQYQDIREHSHSEVCSPSDLIVQSLFTKPRISSAHADVVYQKNQEYRFVWVFLEEHTRRMLEVEDDPILIRNVEAVRQACAY